jgi:hypothetical protein
MKAYTHASLTPLTIFPTVSSNPTTMDRPVTFSHYPKLFAAWNMDDAVGATSGSSVRQDWLGNYDLTDQWSGGEVTVAAGKVGDGTGYALTGGVAFSNALLTLPTSVTVTGWFKIPAGTENQYLFSYGSNATTGGFNIHVWPSVFTGVRFFTQSGANYVDSGVVITLDVWHFFAATHHADGTNTIQVDGSSPVSIGSQPAPIASQALRLGRHAGGSGQLYGSLDAIQIYGSVLPQSEITALSAGWEPTSMLLGDLPPYTYLWDFGDALPTVNQTGLYGYWPLDEASGNPRASTLGTAPDLAETGGGVPEDAGGRFSNAVSSTEAAASHLQATLAPALAVSAGLTIAFWFKWPEAPSLNADSILDLDNGGAHVSPYFYIVRFFNSNYLEVVFQWTPGGAIGLPIPRLGPFAINTWHLVVVTYDAISGVLTGRVDDGCIASAVVTSAPTSKQTKTVPPASLVTANASTFSRLRLLNGNFTNFEGSLDDLRIWTTVLTAAEIADLWYRSDEETPTYSYGEAGAQTISATVTSAHGCVASRSIEVVVS